MKRKGVLLLSIFLLLFTTLWGQERTITGKVLDKAGEPIYGATVAVKGAAIGTISDSEGNFSLTIPDDAILVVSFVGYTPQEVDADELSEFTFTLEEDMISLEEVVVVGYTEMRKKDLTGAVSIVLTDVLTDQPVASLDQMIEGRVTGVTVLPDNAPGGAASVRIRGFNTFRNNDPLYIVDGVPLSHFDLSMLNPSDIASFQILKDASSASIYGVRAANGVVIITTKQGRPDQMEITFDSYVGTQRADNLPRMLNAQEYGDLLWEATLNDGGTPASDIYGSGASPVIPTYLDDAQVTPSDDVDWVQEIFRPATVQSYNLGMTKGTNNSSQAFSVSYFNQEGIIKTTEFERVTGRLNTSYRYFDRLTIGQNLILSQTKSVSTNTYSLLGSIVHAAYKFPSIVPVYDNNGEFAGSPLNDIPNPMGNLDRGKDNFDKNIKIFGNLYADLEIIRGLNLRTSFGLNYNNRNFPAYNARYKEFNTQRTNSNLNVTSAWDRQWVWTNTLKYNANIENHNISVLLGGEMIRNNSENLSASREGFSYDDLNFRYLNYGDENTQKNSGSASEYSIASFFGRVDYNYAHRYMVSFIMRRDGASFLSEENKWDNFPSIAAAWRVSDEPFFPQNAVVSNAKLRAGWGTNGNPDVPPYSSIASYKSNTYHTNYDITGSQHSVISGITTTRIANENLRWEPSTETNIGMDLGFWENQIELVVDLYSKKTEDLIVELPVNPLYGGTNSSVWDNVGSMENKGYEVALGYRSKALSNNKLRFIVTLNFSQYRNELTGLKEGVEFISVPDNILHSINFDQETSRSYVGFPIASFYGYDMIGIFQSNDEIASHAAQEGAQPGDFIFRDVDGNGIIDGNDRTIIGNPHPDFTYGIQLGVNYSGIDLSLFFTGSKGNDIYDLGRYYTDFYSLSAYNKHEKTKEAWSPSNTDATVPRLTLDDPNNNIRPSSYYVQDGSYIRLKSLTLGYTLPKNLSRNIGSSGIRIYLQAYNLFTITDYEGADPKVGMQAQTTSHRNRDFGVDRGIYPASKTYMIGVNLAF